MELWWLYKGFEVHKNERGEPKVFLKGYPEDLESIARHNPTPLFLFNADRIEENLTAIRQAFARNYDGEAAIYFAMKACYVPHVIHLLRKLGCGADAASPNEARLGLKSGIPPQKMMFTGVSVSDADMKELANMGVRINIDSFSQLRRLVGLIQHGELPPSQLPLAVRINPEVGAVAGPHTITAGARTPQGVPIKFGIEPATVPQVLEYARNNGLLIDTLHFHIGSGWLRPGLEAFRQALRNVAQLYHNLVDAGYRLTRLDVGGGMGVRRRRGEEGFPWNDYAATIDRSLKEVDIKPQLLILEPGDSIVLDAGIMLTTVNTVEEKYGVEHVFVDSGMGTFPSIRLYRHWNEFVNVSRPEGPIKEYAVDGNVCETGDTFTFEQLRPLPEVKEGDILAFLDAGGYNLEQSSNYCMRGRGHVMLRKENKLIACTSGVESFDEIISRFMPVDPSAFDC